MHPAAAHAVCDAPAVACAADDELDPGQVGCHIALLFVCVFRGAGADVRTIDDATLPAHKAGRDVRSDCFERHCGGDSRFVCNGVQPRRSRSPDEHRPRGYPHCHPPAHASDAGLPGPEPCGALGRPARLYGALRLPARRRRRRRDRLRALRARQARVAGRGGDVQGARGGVRRGCVSRGDGAAAAASPRGARTVGGARAGGAASAHCARAADGVGLRHCGEGCKGCGGEG
mmetsp:Transcript_19371/g.62998  ORF Transcript_19371/g.62998 Transcript_19371/m.62998 type:complete len:231 (+) Transcript_19371:342-1034(+)